MSLGTALKEATKEQREKPFDHKGENYVHFNERKTPNAQHY